MGKWLRSFPSLAVPHSLIGDMQIKTNAHAHQCIHIYIYICVWIDIDECVHR
eukprot:NODE_87_length_1994_cov_425.024165_g65_i0.p10 GENE.NODE_87_length_1994_cov_425.024165_g65_i0~~NODE_87_length_1994_cov_425.024165_g65_i0.p10  ORF type:complete len:52 (-),score=1.95 NODE_87_length_1994_cov_425.024165_g65_i0:1106-1261(-)